MYICLLFICVYIVFFAAIGSLLFSLICVALLLKCTCHLVICSLENKFIHHLVIIMRLKTKLLFKIVFVMEFVFGCSYWSASNRCMTAQFSCQLFKATTRKLWISWLRSHDRSSSSRLNLTAPTKRLSHSQKRSEYLLAWIVLTEGYAKELACLYRFI